MARNDQDGCPRAVRVVSRSEIRVVALKAEIRVALERLACRSTYRAEREVAEWIDLGGEG